MDVIDTLEGLEPRITAWRRTGARVGVMPMTPGIHAGKAALVAAARERGERSVAVVLAGPARFGLAEEPPADGDPAAAAVPRADLARLEAAGADIAFVPDPVELYPPGYATRVLVRLHEAVLCTARFPDRFDGVAQLAVKLVNMAGARSVYFGEKDWQQMLLVRAAVRDLNLEAGVVPVPTVREGDGLAMSTRNRALDAAARAAAPRMFAAISRAAQRIARGAPTELACAEAADELILAGFRSVEYLECRDADSLRIAPSPGRGARVFAAAQLGAVRLIDSAAVPAPQGG